VESNGSSPADLTILAQFSCAFARGLAAPLAAQADPYTPGMGRARKESPLEKAQRYERSDRHLLEDMRQLVSETERPLKRRFYRWVVRLMETTHKSSNEKLAKTQRNEFR
jgi:hypothetical protein